MLAATAAATPAATPQLIWMAQSDWHDYECWPAAEYAARRRVNAELRQVSGAAPKKEQWMSSNLAGPCLKRRHSDERAAAAGYPDDPRFERVSDSQVRRAERAKEDPAHAEREKEAEARRKRVRRIELEKEDRDAMRELALSRCDSLPLEATPAGLRETAVDGTPRRAKAAGAKLRELTVSFYQKLINPRLYNVEPVELGNVQVPTTCWLNHRRPYDPARGREPHQGYVQDTRPLLAWKVISKELKAEEAKAKKAEEAKVKKAEKAKAKAEKVEALRIERAERQKARKLIV